MSSSKLLVVLGATGKQGGSVVDTILNDPTSNYRIRAITRRTTSPSAQALQARGAEVVEGDMDKPDTLTAAFKDASAIFIVSNFWEAYFNPANADKPKKGQQLNEWAAENETQQLVAAIDAAAKVPTLERLVISSISGTKKWSGGKYTHNFHFDAKFNAVEHCRVNQPALFAKTSVFQAGFFLSNYTEEKNARPTRREDGIVQFATILRPDVKLPFIAAEEDSGPFVKALLNDTPGKNLIAYREWLTPKELTEIFEKTTGLKSEYVQQRREDAGHFLPPDLREEIADMMEYCNDFGYEARDDPTISHPRDLATPPTLKTAADYFKKFDWEEVLKR